MGTLRTIKTTERYMHDIKNGILEGECNLCAKLTLKDFKLWRIVQNDYPYDLIADVHHMLIPKRHCQEEHLTSDEMSEMRYIKRTYLDSEYEWFLEASNKKKSIPAHFHLHVIVAKDA